MANNNNTPGELSLSLHNKQKDKSYWNGKLSSVLTYLPRGTSKEVIEFLEVFLPKIVDLIQNSSTINIKKPDNMKDAEWEKHIINISKSLSAFDIKVRRKYNGEELAI